MKNNLTIEFIGRSMDYVQRQIELSVWSKQQTANEEDPGKEFSHVDNSIDYLSRFMEGSTTFELFTIDGINRFVDDATKAGVWRFIQGMQQYTFATFEVEEVVDIAKSLAFAIAPNKILTLEGLGDINARNDKAQSPSGTVAYENGPDDIMELLFANPWLMPLVSLGMSREIPTISEDKE